MISINGKIYKKESFGDGTLKCETPEVPKFWIVNGDYDCPKYKFTWCYDSDDELFQLWCLVKHLEQVDRGASKTLTMPYIPHARQDRNVSGRLFTLKYFSEILNQMDFDEVYVLDPHSDVSKALIDRVVEQYDPFNYESFKSAYVDSLQFMFPDNGAAKKYVSKNLGDYIVGIKHRNQEGRIDSYAMSGLKDTTKVVVIRDDICSYGGTFSAAAKELKSKGVEKIILCVSHCELNIIKGDVLDYIDELYTTDSLLDMSVFDTHDFEELDNVKRLKEKIHFVRTYRN